MDDTRPEPVALVTGAARGMGRATAERLAAAGWRLVLVDRCDDLPDLDYPLARPADLDEVVAAAGGDGRAVGVVADTRDRAAMDAAVAAAVQRWGRLDAAVAVAGCIAGGPLAWETDDRVWDTLLSVNLGGVWTLAGAAVPAMVTSPPPRRGRLVAVASAGALVGLPRLAAYCAAKAGVVGLVRALAAELGPLGITANAVAPGSTTGPMLDASARVYGLGGAGELAVHHVTGRLLAPAEPAALLAWLCSEDSSALTGAVIPADAGMTAH